MITESLRLLQLDYLDCVMIHFPGRPKDFNPQKSPGAAGFFSSLPSDPERAPEVRMVMWEALQECLKDGKIKHIGVSNFNRHHIETMLLDQRRVYPSKNNCIL